MKKHVSENGVEWLTFDLFSEFPNLVHGVFLKHGGVSVGEFASLNFGLTAGDKLENVLLNRSRALKALNLTSFTSLFQMHGNEIVEAKPGVFEEADGFITDQKQLALFILHADCQAALFYDPIHHALANVHCGWRGNVQNIYKNAIFSMKERFGSRPEDLLVGISPSLGPEASEFIHYRQEMPEAFHPFQIKPTYFDLWQISKWQLQEAGILPHHMEIAGICTFKNTNDFFSYRRVKKSGRHATIAALT